jgi:hypothetical protein
MVSGRILVIHGPRGTCPATSTPNTNRDFPGHRMHAETKFDRTRFAALPDDNRPTPNGGLMLNVAV